MSHTRRLLPHILTQLILVFTLVSCTSGVNPTLDVGGNQTSPTLSEATRLPSATLTPTVEPTATNTLEPTESPAQIVDELKLKDTPLYETRTFAIEGNYLIDNYNNVPKAVKNEDDTWRKLDYTNPEDAEVMYGALVPKDGEYIFPDMVYDSNGPYGRIANFRYLGDWETEKIEYEGQEISLYSVLGGLRDGDGKLHVVRLAYDSLDVQPAHNPELWCFYPSDFATDRIAPRGGMGWNWWPVDVVVSSWLRVGETLGIYIYEATAYPHVSFKNGSHPDDYPAVNNAQHMLMTNLYSEYPELFQLTAAERKGLEMYQWPSRSVTLALPYGLAVGERASLDDCNVR